MRLLICDPETDLVRMTEIVADRVGHEVVGVADTAHSAERLIASARPELVVLDPALGFGSDYDLIAEALRAGAQVILFSRTARELPVWDYDPAPVLVDKPAIDALEDALRHIKPRPPAVTIEERRRRPARVAGGRTPLGPDDNEALYETIGSAESGDAIVWIDLTAAGSAIEPDRVQASVSTSARSGDRLLVSDSAVRGVLPGAGLEGAESFRRRVLEAAGLPADVGYHAVVVHDSEHPSDAFERLRRSVRA